MQDPVQIMRANDLFLFYPAGIDPLHHLREQILWLLLASQKVNLYPVNQTKSILTIWHALRHYITTQPFLLTLHWYRRVSGMHHSL